MKNMNSSSIKIQSVLCNPSRLFVIICWGICLCCSTNAFSQSLMNGQVIDSVDRVPVAGTTVTIHKGEQLLGRAESNVEGNYEISFEIPSRPRLQILTIRAEHENYVRSSLNIQIVSGEPIPSIRISLLPDKLSDCRPLSDPSVIVGYFFPPLSMSGTSLGLSTRIADALKFDLVTRIQQLHIDWKLQPSFKPCEKANPEGDEQRKDFARSLESDVFVSGYIKVTEHGYKVRTLIIDRYDLFEAPFSSENPNVDLDDPGAAQLTRETHVAILNAIAVSYEQEHNYDECVNVTVVAEQILGNLLPEIEDIRKRCQKSLPHQGLLPGGTP